MDYLEDGFRRGRNPSRLFDAEAYCVNHPDVAASGINPLLHYLKHGKAEGRYCNRVVDLSGIKSRSRQREKTPPLVLFESHNLDIQGAQTSLFEVATGIAKHGSYVAALSTSSDGPMAQAYADESLEIFFHGTPPLNICPDPEFHIDRLEAFYQAIAPAVLHINTLANLLPAISARRLGIPYVLNIREGGDPTVYFDQLPVALREEGRNALSDAKEAIFVAQATHTDMGDVLNLPARTSVIPNGLDGEALLALAPKYERQSIRKALDIEENDVVILNVGTVCDRKGQLDLAGAAERVAPVTGRKLIFAFVGTNDSDYSRSLSEMVSSLSRSDIRFIMIEQTAHLGDRKTAVEMYRAADFFVLTSREESYPRVTLEAMAFALPIVSTPCAGVMEQLENESTAVFYPEGDVEVLAKKLDELLMDSKKRSTLGRRAQNRLSGLFSHTQMIQAYTEAYDRAAGSDQNALG